jgi:hypothetical protein
MIGLLRRMQQDGNAYRISWRSEHGVSPTSVDSVWACGFTYADYGLFTGAKLAKRSEVLMIELNTGDTGVAGTTSAAPAYLDCNNALAEEVLCDAPNRSESSFYEHM